MRNRNYYITFVILTASLVGLILSVLLILEYFGLAPEATDTVCARGNVNACTIVSSSPFAAIKGIPLIGDVPTAVFGFIFYGFTGTVVLVNFIRRKHEEIRQLNILILLLSVIAFTGDIALYLVSVLIIKFVCPLCAGTYISTMVILLFSVIMLISNRNIPGGSFFIDAFLYIKKNFLAFILITVILAAAGIGIGSSSRLFAQTKQASSYEDRLQKAIRQYEMAKTIETNIDEAPFFGNRNALAKFLIFFDFTCIHCKKEFEILENLIKKYPETVSIAYKFFTLDGDCGRLQKGRNDEDAEACIASAAAFCGHSQDMFMEYAKILFDNYHEKNIKFTEKTVRDAAKTAGLDLSGFDLCFGSKTVREFVKTEYLETERLDISNTPTVFLNGKRLQAGSRKADVLEGLVKYCTERSK